MTTGTPGGSGARVLLVAMNYAPETTGIGPYTASLAAGLAADGFRVDVLTAPPHYPQWRVWPHSEWRARETSGSLRVRRIAGWVPEHPNALTRTAFELLYGLRFALRRYPAYDAAILLSPALFSSAVVRLRLRATQPRVPVVLWMQDRYGAGTREILQGPLAIAGRGVAAVERWLARSCDRVVVIHDRWKPELTSGLGVADDRIAVVRNWTHLSTPPAADVAATRERLGWEPAGDEVVVLHAGNMGLKQGLENVVAAGKLAAEQSRPVRFVLLGDGTQRARLEELAGGCPQVQFLAGLPEAEFVAALGAADVLLVNEKSGLRETAVPSKLTSYFSAGRPVLGATEADSVTADEVRASGAGIVVAPGEPQALLDGALEIASRADDYAAAGPAYTEAVLSERAGVARFAGLLNDLMTRTHEQTPTAERTTHDA